MSKIIEIVDISPDFYLGKPDQAFRLVLTGGSGKEVELESVRDAVQWLNLRSKLPSFTPEMVGLLRALRIHSILSRFIFRLNKLRYTLEYIEGEEDNNKQWFKLKTFERHRRNEIHNLVITLPEMKTELEEFYAQFYNKLVATASMARTDPFSGQSIRAIARKDLLEELDNAIEGLQVPLSNKVAELTSA